jgi:hypothetical protein
VLSAAERRRGWMVEGDDLQEGWQAPQQDHQEMGDGPQGQERMAVGEARFVTQIIDL